MLSQYVIMKVKTNRILIDLLSLVRSNVRIKKSLHILNLTNSDLTKLKKIVNALLSISFNICFGSLGMVENQEN